MALVLIYTILCCISTTLINDVASVHISEGLTVTLKHGGSLTGRHMLSERGRYFRGFLGIRYAQPPIGDLRFSAPLPADPWEGMKMATVDGSACSQGGPAGPSNGDEDCLFLNVYGPQEPRTKEPLPVIVWIHGGGFAVGDGSSESINPSRFMDHDVIIVSMNYRMSTLGFLSSETLDIPGNFAFKDQLMALKWVNEHISVFGGDVNSITLAGQSAGAASVAYHTFSEKSKGFFHRAIASSGTYYDAWARPTPKGYAASVARQVADIVGCGQQKGSWATTLKCLRTVPARNLTDASKDLLVWSNTPTPAIPIVLEPEHEDAFLTQPIQVTEYSNSMPLMLGFNKDEAIVFFKAHSEYYTDFDLFTKKLDTYFSYALTSQLLSPEIQAFTKQAILDFYFGNKTITKSQNLTDAFTDSMFVSGIDEHIRSRLSTEYPSAPTYLFQFEQKTETSVSYVNGDEFGGVAHGDNSQLLFNTALKRSPTVIPSKRDQELTVNMIDMYYNFAAVGDPSPANTYLPKWKPIKSYPPQSMRMGSLNEDDLLLELTDNYPVDRTKFWHDLLPYLQTAYTNNYEQSAFL